YYHHTSSTELYSLSLHDALPISSVRVVMDKEDAFRRFVYELRRWWPLAFTYSLDRFGLAAIEPIEGGVWYEVDITGQKIAWGQVDRKSTRLNSSHVKISYAVFCY